MSNAAAISMPVIRYQNGTEIVPKEEEDETYLGVERYSGVSLITKERIFVNMVIYGDELFQLYRVPGDNGWFYPVTFIKRESTWSKSQVDNTFGEFLKN